jgi:hypothetical protein
MKKSFWSLRVEELLRLQQQEFFQRKAGIRSLPEGGGQAFKTMGRFSRMAGEMAVLLLLAGLMMIMLVAPAHAQGSGAEDIKDIRGIISLAGLQWWIYVGGLLALAGLAFQICLLKRRKPPAAKAESAESVAFRELDKARDLLREGQAREFSLDISEILRRYIEDRFHVSVVQRTTEEFLQDMRRSRLAGVLSHLDELDVFLRLCDQAKFGREALTLSEMETMWFSARVFVEQSGLALALGQVTEKDGNNAPVEPQAV